MAIRRTARQRQRAASDTYDVFIGTLVVAVMASFVVALICLGIFGTDHDNYGTARDARARIVTYVNKAPNPQAAAQSLLDIDSRGIHTDLRTGAQDVNGNLSNHALKAERSALARTAADTGKPLKLNLSAYSFDYLWLFIKLYMGGMMMVAGTFLFLYYWRIDCRKYRERYFLADMPWKRVWPVAFVALVPISWPFMLVSAIRMRKAEEPPEPRRFFDVDDYDGYYGVDDYDYARPAQEERPAQKPTFINAPIAGRQQYHELRTVSWSKEHQRRLANLESDERHFSVRLTELSEDIRWQQSKLNAVRSELALERAAMADSDQHVPTAEQLDREFDRLMQLPGIKAVRVVNDSVHLLFEARMTYQGTTYDLGDWELWFSADDDHFYTRELRSGVRPTWQRSYPVYRIGDGFCFGSRETEIRDNLRKGQYLEAVELAVACMQSVNKKDRHFIPEAFYPADETEKVEVQQ